MIGRTIVFATVIAKEWEERLVREFSAQADKGNNVLQEYVCCVLHSDMVMLVMYRTQIKYSGSTIYAKLE
jgi:hypothetical protein